MNLNIQKWRFNTLIPKRIDDAIKQLSLTEKIVFYLLLFLFLLSSVSMVWNLNRSTLMEIPARGGSLSEGIIGSPRFINPVLATSDTDRDLASLIYSGLLKITPEGELDMDIAEKYEVSEDQLIYTFTIKDNLYFHDGEPLSTDDIEFTIKQIQNPYVKSPKRANWDGVAIEKISDKEIRFILKQPYSPFLENATIGILPKHIWKDTTAEQFSFSKFNTEPIGSGPYKTSSMKKNSLGIIESYDLRAFKKYSEGEAYISKLTIKFFSDEDTLLNAYNKDDIESMNSISPDKIEKIKNENTRIERTPLPRIFGVFFNQNHAPIFANKEVRMALNESIDRKKIVDEVLKGYGMPIYTPIPSTSKYYLPIVQKEEVNRISSALKILEKNGWKLDKDGLMHKKDKKTDIALKFTLSTSNAPELKKAAEMMKQEWEKIGAKVDLKIFEAGDLNQNIIRTREYEALLFGEIIGRDVDLFAFWHSSQRKDPGLNIAMYTNVTADKLLENIRLTSDENKKEENYKKFQKEIALDTPAVFTYSPDFIYIIPEKIKGFNVKNITMPSERFSGINKWYIKTEKVWPIFAN